MINTGLVTLGLAAVMHLTELGYEIEEREGATVCTGVENVLELTFAFGARSLSRSR